MLSKQDEGDFLVSFPDPFRKNREGVWQHVLHRRVRAHCTVRANHVAEFSYVMFIKNVRLWRLLTVLVLLILTRLLMLPVGEWGAKRLFPKQIEAVEAFISGRDVFVCLPAGGYIRTELLLWLPSHRLRLFEGSNLLDCRCCDAACGHHEGKSL